jgi:hypothetical protein
MLDPYALRYSLSHDARVEMVKFLENPPPMQERYLNDIQFMLVESLIRALELRMNKVAEPKLSSELNSYLRDGAIFIRYFYESLKEFETGQDGIKIFYAEMVKNLEFSQIKSAVAAAQATPLVKAVEPSPMSKLLKQANSSLADENYPKAKEIFESVLKDHDANNGEALYGLGLVHIMQKDDPKPARQLAKGYFQKAIEAPNCPAASKVWAYIYLGRIFDLEALREDAVHEYQAAIALGDNTRNAQEIAQKGLKEPFGTKK